MTRDTKGPSNPALANARLETALSDLSATLSHTAPVTQASGAVDPLLVLGVGRSGSTMLMQYLAASGAFAYPSNIISRFFMRPALGHQVQELLLNPALDFSAQFQQLREGVQPISFESKLGKTTSPLGPNEFWYFWRRFFDFESCRKVPNDVLLRAPGVGLINELSEWRAHAGKPIAMKGVIATWTMDRLLDAMPDARVAIILRNPIDTMIALLNARQTYWGDMQSWYGLQLPERLYHLAQGPIEEVAIQVAAFERISQQLAKRDGCQIIEYTSFCAAPHDIWNRPGLSDYVEDGRIDVEMIKAHLPNLKFEARAADDSLLRSEFGLERTDLRRVYDTFKDLMVAYDFNE